MEKRYLLNTNLLIYYSRNEFKNEETKILIRKILNESFNISFITQIEFLGWQKHTEESIAQATEFINSANTYQLNDEIIDKTISIRRGKNIKIPVAIIAVTCMINNLTLLTRNNEDFNGLELKIKNPFQ